MRCAVYLRRSVDRDKEDQSTSIESQKSEIITWAEKRGAEVLQDWIVEDRGYSGSTEHRPGFQRLLEAAKSGEAPFDTLLFYDYDRFFRNHRKQQRYLDVFEDDHGIRCISVTEEGDSDELVGVKGIMNEGQRKKNIKHTNRVMKAIAEQGLSCGGTAPYGYRAVCVMCSKPVPCGCLARSEGRRHSVRWGIDRETAPMVKRIFDGYADGMSLARLAQSMNASKAKTPGEGTLRKGRGWAATSLRAILRNETYTGVRIYRKTKKVRRYPTTRQVFRPAEEWVKAEGAHPAIIDRALWKRVQEVMRDRGRIALAAGAGARARLTGRYLLSGYLVCKGCGGCLTLKSMNRGWKYYSCRRATEGTCDNPGGPIRMDIAEAVVEGLIRDAILEPSKFAALLAMVQDRVKHAESSLEGDSEKANCANPQKVKVRLGRLDREIDNLVEFLCNAPRSEFGAVRERLAALEKERKTLRDTVDSIRPSEPRRHVAVTAGELEDEISRLREDLLRLPPEKQRQLFDLLALVLRVSPDKTAEVEVDPMGLLGRCGFPANPASGTIRMMFSAHVERLNGTLARLMNRPPR